MKHLILTILFISFGFSSQNPIWFYNLPTLENQIIGYGEATKLSDAKAEAKNEIASVISTKVESYLKIDKVTTKDGIDKRVEKSIKVSTNIKLEELHIEESAFINDKWYIAISYDYSPFAVKFKKLLGGYNLKNQQQNNYLTKTNLFKNLNTIIGKRLDYKIHNKNNMWYLSYKNSSLKLGTKDFENLFTFKNSNIIELELNQDTFVTNNDLSFNISSKKEGYVSIFYMGSNGQIGLIKDNLSITKNIMYPTSDKIIVKSDPNKDKKFMIVVIYSTNKIDLNDFEKITKQKIRNTNFIDMLNYFNKYEYLTYVSKVVKSQR
ncbi:MAG: hypothetical protein KAJ49_10245 [Arcobacteraceae bacterium]|nr:hypothetical protein [Arcobacteraceae bacterium]